MEHILKGPPAGMPGLSFENYAVRLASAGSIIGTLEATIHNSLAEVAYLFGPQYWGKGYATEALSWFSDLFLGRDSITGLWAATLPTNLRSAALLTRCGYKQVEPRHAPKLLSYEEGDLVFCLKRAGLTGRHFILAFQPVIRSAPVNSNVSRRGNLRARLLCSLGV